MAIDTRLPDTFFLPVSEGISLSLPKSVTKEKEEAGLKQLLDKAKMLTTDQHAIFTARVYLIAGEIKAYIQEMRRRGYSENEVERISEALNSRLHALGDHFLDKTFENYQIKMRASCSAMNFDRRLQEIKIHYPDFTASPTLKAPSAMGLISTARKLQIKVKEELPPSFAHSRANVEQNMGIARAVGWAVDKIADGMRKGCEATPQSKKICQYGQDITQGLMEMTGLSKLAVEPKALPQVLHDLYGIDKEAGVKYANDGLNAGVLLATSAIPAGVGAVFTRIRPFSTVALKSISLQQGMNWTMRLLKEDAGSVVIPFYQGIKPSTLRACEECFRGLSFSIHRIACKFFADTPNRPMFVLWREYNHLLKQHIPDLNLQVARSGTAENVIGVLEVMMKEATGMDSAFMTLEKSSPSKNVFKVSNSMQSLYIAEMSLEESLANYFAMHHVRKLNLKHSDVSAPVAIKRHGHSSYVAMTDEGVSFKSLFQNRSEQLHMQAFELGRALGEFASKKAVSVQPATSHHQFFVEVCKSRVLDACQGKSISKQQTLRIYNLVEETLQNTPVFAGLAHGDPHIGNFTWKWETGKVGIIDLARFTHSLSVHLQPTGFPVMDYVGLIRSIVLNGNRMNLSEAEIISYVNAFKEGYHTMHPGEPMHVNETINLIYDLN